MSFHPCVPHQEMGGCRLSFTEHVKPVIKLETPIKNGKKVALLSVDLVSSSCDFLPTLLNQMVFTIPVPCSSKPSKRVTIQVCTLNIEGYTFFRM